MEIGISAEAQRRRETYDGGLADIGRFRQFVRREEAAGIQIIYDIIGDGPKFWRQLRGRNELIQFAESTFHLKLLLFSDRRHRCIDRRFDKFIIN